MNCHTCHQPGIIEFKKEKKNAPTEQKGSCRHGRFIEFKKKYKKDDDGEDVNARITQVVVGSTLARICDMWYFPISFHKYYNNINVAHIEYFCDVNISQRSVSIYVVHLWRTFFPAIWVLLFSVWFFHFFFFLWSRQAFPRSGICESLLKHTSNI